MTVTINWSLVGLLGDTLLSNYPISNIKGTTNKNTPALVLRAMIWDRSGILFEFFIFWEKMAIFSFPPSRKKKNFFLPRYVTFGVLYIALQYVTRPKKSTLFQYTMFEITVITNEHLIQEKKQ